MTENNNSGASRTKQNVNTTEEVEMKTWGMEMKVLGEEIGREDSERKKIEKQFADDPEEQMEALYEFDLERQATGSGGWNRYGGQNMQENNNSGSHRMEHNVMVDIYCSEITNHNYDGLCAEEYCDNRPTSYFKMRVNGLNLFIPVCDEHADIIMGR